MTLSVKKIGVLNFRGIKESAFNFKVGFHLHRISYEASWFVWVAECFVKMIMFKLVSDG